LGARVRGGGEQHINVRDCEFEIVAAGASRGMRRQCPAMERKAREEAATARVTAEQK